MAQESLTAPPAPGSVALLPASGHRVQPWLSGGGSTMLVAAVAAQAGASAATGSQVEFAWRLSVATVDSAAPFSAYPGVDRVLMALSEGDLSLELAGDRVRLGRGDVVEFAGEDPVAAADVAGPTLDLNLMLRRGEVTGTLAAADVSGPTTLCAEGAAALAVVALGAGLRFDGGALAVHDTLILGTGASVSLDGSGQVALARVTSSR